MSSLIPQLTHDGNRGDFDAQNQVLSSLDTSSRIIDTKSTDIDFTPVDSIDRNVKKANIETMKYYVSEKTQEIKKSLISKIHNEWILRDYPEINPNEKSFISDIENEQFPLDVIIKYNRGIVNYKNACLLDFAEKHFSSYIKSIEKKSRYLYMEHKGTGDKSIKKIITRYSDDYRNKIKKRMNWLMWNYGNENCCLLTLTIDPKKYNYDKEKMWNAITKKYKFFILKLKRYFREHNRPFPPYLYAIESMFGRPENNYMSRGNPHLHSAFFNCKYLAPVEVLERFWGQGFVKINSTAKNEKIRYPIHYITKYITSTFTNNSPDNSLIQGLVWLFNKHSFDHSAGLVLPLYPKGSGDWELLGIVSIKSGYHQIDEMIAIQDLMYSLYGGFKNPPPEKRLET